jgi:hypothetical protein
MANMSYCRFQNTANDLRDCVYAIEGGEYSDGISKSEKRGLEGILELAHQLVNELEYEIEEILNSDDN